MVLSHLIQTQFSSQNSTNMAKVHLAFVTLFIIIITSQNQFKKKGTMSYAPTVIILEYT